MLTPQEARERAFPRKMMGGYSMSAVDDFLDELIEDYAALYKENTALKAKMKVLVEKVDDYRSTEDSMRATLLTAQKMAESIQKEAEEKRDEMLARAQADSLEQLKITRTELTDAETGVQMLRSSMSKYRKEAMDNLRRQMQLLEQLPDVPDPQAETPAGSGEGGGGPTAGEISATVLAAYAETDPRTAGRVAGRMENVPETAAGSGAPAGAGPVGRGAGTAAAAAPVRPSPAEAPQTVPERSAASPSVSPAAAETAAGAEPQSPESGEDDEPTRKIRLENLRLEDLQFGSNYTGGRR